MSGENLLATSVITVASDDDAMSVVSPDFYGSDACAPVSCGEDAGRRWCQRFRFREPCVLANMRACSLPCDVERKKVAIWKTLMISPFHLGCDTILVSLPM